MKSLMNTRYGPSDRVRTCGLMVPNHPRYQLRHTRIFRILPDCRGKYTARGTGKYARYLIIVSAVKQDLSACCRFEENEYFASVPEILSADPRRKGGAEHEQRTESEEQPESAESAAEPEEQPEPAESEEQQPAAESETAELPMTYRKAPDGKSGAFLFSGSVYIQPFICLRRARLIMPSCISLRLASIFPAP